MQWQDITLSIGSIIFTIALIPSVRSKDKPALLTSVTTASILALFAFTYGTLSLWFSVFTTSFNCLAWATLAVQKYFQIRTKTPAKD